MAAGGKDRQAHSRGTADVKQRKAVQGDVVLVYPGPRPPAGLAALARSVAPAFSAGLAAAGQAVILSTRPGTTGIIALAWAHMLHAVSVQNPCLRHFIVFWLGRGAGSA